MLQHLVFDFPKKGMAWFTLFWTKQFFLPADLVFFFFFNVYTLQGIGPLGIMFLSPGLPQGDFMVIFFIGFWDYTLFWSWGDFLFPFGLVFNWGVAAFQWCVSFSVVQRREPAAYKHISPLSQTSLPTTPSNPPIRAIAEHQAKLPVPYSRMPLAICFIHGSEHMSVPTSQLTPIPSPTHVHTTVSTSVSLFLPCKHVHLHHFI